MANPIFTTFPLILITIFSKPFFIINSLDKANGKISKLITIYARSAIFISEFPENNTIINGVMIIEETNAPLTPHKENLRSPFKIYVNGSIATPGGVAAITTKPIKIF